MKIALVESYVAEQLLERPFFFSQFGFDRRQICLVKVIAEDGSYGWGEGYGPAGVVQAGVEFLTPLVIGEDSLGVEAIWNKMRLRSLDYARRGVLVASMSAIDIAIWDLRGKLLGQPVSVLLGGRRREKVKVYATGMYFVDSDDLSLSFLPMVGIGFDYAAADGPSSLIAPQLFTYLTAGSIYFESWIQGFLNSMFDYGDDSFYTRNFVLYSLNDTVAIGPQVEVTFDLTASEISSIAPGLRANVGYGENNTLGVFVGFETQKGEDETGITGRMTFVRSW